MIAIIRISGRVDVKKDVDATLNALRLRKKYICIVLRERKEIPGMLKKVENYVAYGKISKEVLAELVRKRGRKKGNKEINKEEAEKITSEFSEGKTEKKLEELGIKPFFRLHPPRGGINTKQRFPKGVLGNNKEKINELIRRML